MNAKIGLWSDAINFPSIPMMKISAYHKVRGDNVKLVDDFSERFDVAYCSKTFNLPAIKKIPKLIQMPLADEIIAGGTGFAIDVISDKERYHKYKDPTLPHDIEHFYPDYELYSELTRNTAFGFLTRGCSNRCGFCVVGGKEGAQSVHVADLSEFWHGQNNITIMDANLLACANADNLIVSLIQSGANIDFTQGILVRHRPNSP